MKSLAFISLVFLVSAATRAGHAELQVLTPAQRDCLNDLFQSSDHRGLIQAGLKISKISFDEKSEPHSSVTVIYDKNDEMITRTCTPLDQEI